MIADVESAGQSELVVCGTRWRVTVPGVVAKLGTSRVREIVLAAAFVPPRALRYVDASVVSQFTS